MQLDKNYVISFLADLSQQLLIKSSFINNNSLYEGKIAAAIFMYDYCELVDEEIYYNFANEVTQDVIENLSEQDISYTMGLTGIGAGITFLLDNNIIEADGSLNLFENLYSKISRQLLLVDNGVSSVGASIFLALQLAKSDNHISSELERLLHLERIVAHVDLINLNSKKSFFLEKDNLAEHMLTKWGFQLVSNFIQDVYYGICLLKITTHQRIYPEISDSTIRELREITQKYFNYYLTSESDVIAKLDAVNNIHLIAKLYSINDINNFDDINREQMDKVISELLSKKSFKIAGYKMIIHIETLNILDKINRLKKSISMSNSIAFYLMSLIKYCTKSNFAIESNTKNQVNIGISGLSGIGLTCLSLIDSSTITWEQLIFAQKKIK